MDVKAVALKRGYIATENLTAIFLFNLKKDSLTTLLDLQQQNNPERDH